MSVSVLVPKISNFFASFLLSIFASFLMSSSFCFHCLLPLPILYVLFLFFPNPKIHSNSFLFLSGFGGVVGMFGVFPRYSKSALFQKVFKSLSARNTTNFSS
uniref:Transmembrane protein n=1 Tax=Cacopsylla melanoneura TaxID=428564 RepID=A0A8D8TRI6_9HEMI